ncbi:hypothetical protein M0811_09654 [Anaeramoeba ignava]|uniref:Uncharacterized protein n=1 Tax=Anaeramoeba ignava TaxID=1746090 RepID=A0A9Q0LGH3_ANAIG|nr:hypothetical protein M0811_09654 [Anaeramoeba ignava]
MSFDIFSTNTLFPDQLLNENDFSILYDDPDSFQFTNTLNFPTPKNFAFIEQEEKLTNLIRQQEPKEQEKAISFPFSNSKLEKTEEDSKTTENEKLTLENPKNLSIINEDSTHEIIETHPKKGTGRYFINGNLDPEKEQKLNQFFSQRPRPGIGKKLDKLAELFSEYIRGWGPNTYSRFQTKKKIPKKVIIHNELFFLMAKASARSDKNQRVIKSLQQKSFNARRGVSKFLSRSFKLTNKTSYKRGALVFKRN